MTPRRFSTEEARHVADEYAAGSNSKKLGRKYGVSCMTVLRAVRENGVEVRKPGEPRSGDKHPRWKGGARLVRKGHVHVWLSKDDELASMRQAGSCYVAEHRLVVARSIGRPLLSTETVHHINGNPTDNRLENLQLRMGHHGQGQALRCMECGSHRVEQVPLDD